MFSSVYLFSFFIVILVSTTSAGIGETIYTSTLSPNQVVGNYISGENERSTGVAVCNIDRYSNPPTMYCDIEHNVDELTAANLKLGEKGTTGKDIQQEISILSGSHLSFSIELLGGEELQSVLDGLWYVELLTIDYPDGELRGQIEHQDRFYASLSSRNTVPRASGTDALGFAVGSYSSRERTLDFDLVHSVTLPTATEIRSGPPGTQGEFRDSFSGFSPLFQLADLTRGENSDLLHDLLYLNVKSESNPQGDIRGQLISIDYIETGAFSAVLNGDNSGTSSTAQGVAIVTFNCDTGFMEYLVMHSVGNAQSGLVYSNEEDSESILFSLSGPQSPIFGSVQLLPSEISSLYDERLHFAIQSSLGSNTNGEISGQINQENNFFAYLSGTNVVPPVTTHYIGLFIAEFIDDEALSYEIIHNVENAVEIFIMLGVDGENSAQELFSLPTLRSPARGVIELKSQDFVDAIQFGVTYMEIRTRNNPFGVIRGTIQELDACENEIDDNISLPDDSDGTLRSSETSVLSYLSYIDKDDDEFDVYINVIDSGSWLSPGMLFIIAMIAAAIC